MCVGLVRFGADLCGGISLAGGIAELLLSALPCHFVDNFPCCWCSGDPLNIEPFEGCIARPNRWSHHLSHGSRHRSDPSREDPRHMVFVVILFFENYLIYFDQSSLFRLTVDFDSIKLAPLLWFFYFIAFSKIFWWTFHFCINMIKSKLGWSNDDFCLNSKVHFLSLLLVVPIAAYFLKITNDHSFAPFNVEQYPFLFKLFQAPGMIILLLGILVILFADIKYQNKEKQKPSQFPARAFKRSETQARTLAPAWVSLDYLVGEGQNASFDKKTLQRLKDLEDLDDTKKQTLFDLIDTYIRDAKTRKTYIASWMEKQ